MKSDNIGVNAVRIILSGENVLRPHRERPAWKRISQRGIGAKLLKAIITRHTRNEWQSQAPWLRVVNACSKHFHQKTQPGPIYQAQYLRSPGGYRHHLIGI